MWFAQTAPRICGRRSQAPECIVDIGSMVIHFSSDDIGSNIARWLAVKLLDTRNS